LDYFEGQSSEEGGAVAHNAKAVAQSGAGTAERMKNIGKRILQRFPRTCS